MKTYIKIETSEVCEAVEFDFARVEGGSTFPSRLDGFRIGFTRVAEGGDFGQYKACVANTIDDLQILNQGDFLVRVRDSVDVHVVTAAVLATDYVEVQV